MENNPNYIALFCLLLFFAGLAVGFFILSVIVEATVLYKLEWNRFRWSLRDSLLMNLCSTSLLFFLGGHIGVSVLALESASGPGSYVLNLLLQVLIEGGVLLLIARQPLSETVRVTVIANVVSFVPLIACLGLIDAVTPLYP